MKRFLAVVLATSSAAVAAQDYYPQSQPPDQAVTPAPIEPTAAPPIDANYPEAVQEPFGQASEATASPPSTLEQQKAVLDQQQAASAGTSYVDPAEEARQQRIKAGRLVAAGDCAAAESFALQTGNFELAKQVKDYCPEGSRAELRAGPPDGNAVGDVWEVQEMDGRAFWTRRKDSRTWDGYWLENDGKRVRAPLDLWQKDRKVTLVRQHNGGNYCRYDGVISADWSSIEGLYTCSWAARTPMQWRAQIVRLARSSAPDELADASPTEVFDQR
jgi:hypothetical protein